MPRLLRFSAALLAGCCLHGQPTVLGPVEGFTFDPPTRSIRAVMGSLGSSWLGPALLDDLSFASVAPRAAHGIACRDRGCFLVTGLGGTPVFESLPLPPGTPGGVAWSGDGTAAVLYSRTGGWIQILKGLPGAANPGAALSFSSLGALGAIAVNHTGTRVAIGVAGEHAGVYEITAAESFVPVMAVAGPSALAYDDAGGALFVIDSGRLIEVRGPGFAVTPWTDFGLEDAVAVEVAGDTVYLAGRGDRRLLAVDRLSRQPRASIELGFEPTQMQPLGQASFALRGRSRDGDPLWSFRAGAEPRVYFVPATPLDTTEAPVAGGRRR